MNFKISDGINDQQIEELIIHSKTDDLVINFTSDSERFKDMSSFKNWFKKGRKIYTLTDSSNKLFGIIWFGKKSIPVEFKLRRNFDTSSFGLTFAIRIYKEARGKGFAKLFFKESFKIFELTEDYKQNLNKKMWLESNIDNIPAISLYKSLGFKEAGRSKDGRILMISEKSRNLS